MATENKVPVGAYVTGAIAGAILLVIGGQFWPGYQLDSNAEKLAVDRAEAATRSVAVKTLPALCVANAKADPATAKLTEISAMTSPNERVNAILKTEWVASLDLKLSTAIQRAVADECQKLLFPPAEANATTPG